jgi:hypothetical protein
MELRLLPNHKTLPEYESALVLMSQAELLQAKIDNLEEEVEADSNETERTALKGASVGIDH